VSGDSGPFLDVSPADPDPARADRVEWRAGLFARAREGDAAAFDALVRELNPLLWHVVRSQGLDAEQAGDVVQTTWLELMRRVRDIRSPQALTAWLVTTARRQAWHTRSQERRRSHDGGEAIAEMPADRAEPADLVEASERQRVLWEHLRQLSERCRELLRIVAFVERPDYTVVAEALNMPRGSIGPTRGRCLAKLRESLLADPAWAQP
jgi:RNA polymerase sigma factor (sigma-70 family)